MRRVLPFQDLKPEASKFNDNSLTIQWQFNGNSMAIKLSLKSTRHPTVTKQTVPNSQAIGEPQILLGASFASGVSPVLCLGDLRGPWPGDLVCFKRWILHETNRDWMGYEWEYIMGYRINYCVLILWIGLTIREQPQIHQFSHHLSC